MKHWRRALLGLGMVMLLLIVFAVWLTQPLVGVSPEVSGPQANSERLHRHVEHLATGLSRRDHAHPHTLNRAATYISDRFAESGARISRQKVSADGFGYVNVIARFGPEQGAPVIIGAHYDVHEGTPGADDNASGIAGLLELARLFSQQLPGVPVELVAYTLEEPPYFRTGNMGSAHHAAALAARNVQPLLVVVLEMIGYFDGTPGSQKYPVPFMNLLYPESGDFIAIVGHATNAAEVRRVKSAMRAGGGLSVRSINAPSWVPGIDFSDHASYWQHGIPAVMVTDTSFYRNPNYHEAGDLPATLDYRRMAMVVDGVAAVVRRFSPDTRTQKTNREKQ